MINQIKLRKKITRRGQSNSVDLRPRPMKQKEKENVRPSPGHSRLQIDPFFIEPNEWRGRKKFPSIDRCCWGGGGLGVVGRN